MKPLYIVLIVVAVIIVLLAILYFLGKKLEKKQAEQKMLLEANKQTVSLLVIDKKKMKVKDAQLPASIIEQVPKAARNIKTPMVKVKIGPQIMTMFCDEQIFDLVPVKKEIKAEISGIYIIGVKGVHGTVIKKDEKKKGFFKRAMEKAQEKAGAKPIK
ncbi:MAG: hypothetical protein IJZ00_10800 [Lachnospiraceae bacterium]|nr:hypothetical protein [Lachnospiraceae bacterium]MBQ8262764.1 hypothetical protein [Lachnospiraceae bacterium]